MGILCAIDKNGAVSGISIIALGETPGLGSKINDDAFLQRFYGVKSDISIVKSEPKNENEVQGITGSTLSSKGMAKAVNLAVNPRRLRRYSQLSDYPSVHRTYRHKSDYM